MNITPLRQQYLNIKQKYPNIIVFFRLGDFYETFDDDAKITARELGITLTAREMGKGQKIPLAGIPYHAIDNYLAKLINKGYKVAICEQMTPPGKGLVEREVIRIVTPGTVIEPGILKDKNNNYLASLVLDGDNAGISYIDITTGEFATTQLPLENLKHELERLQPAELLVPDDLKIVELSIQIPVTKVEQYWFELGNANQILIDHFKVISLDGYGCSHLPLAIRAAGAIIHYISETQKAALALIARITTYSTSGFMVLDRQTRINLELFAGSRWGTANSCLLNVIDKTKTAMGGRLLRKWLGQPLLEIEEIKKRQEHIDWFYGNSTIRKKLMTLLSEVADIERLCNRIKSNVATPKDLIALRYSLEKLPEIKILLQDDNKKIVANLNIKSCIETTEIIAKALVDNPAGNLENGGIIREGFSQELDNIRSISLNAKSYLANLEQKEKARTGIKTLKVGYNRVFGYYLEVTNSNLDLIPADFIRKQTLTNGERFYTPELKEYEATILNAQEKIIELEKSIFYQICQQINQNSNSIIESATSISLIDVYCDLAEVASLNNYVKPEINSGNTIIIKNGRHPVVENSPGINSFIPNDTFLSNDDSQLIVLTGPNMAGKSTYLKQVALIVLMAQIGSYIPAESATIGLVDRIFTRIGAQENLSAGQSTFMVEMIETANILNNATPQSLIILDEVGRGTSTYDGLSLAWAVIEAIHNNPQLRAKTLFATHFHELVELAELLPHIKNYNVAVEETEGNVIFLHKIIQGSTDRSYGIHVARLAGLPISVLHRAEEVLTMLEANRPYQNKDQLIMKAKDGVKQLSLFGDTSAVIEEINKLDVNTLSPLEAITKLYELKQKVKKTDLKKST